MFAAAGQCILCKLESSCTLAGSRISVLLNLKHSFLKDSEMHLPKSWEIMLLMSTANVKLKHLLQYLLGILLHYSFMMSLLCVDKLQPL